MTKFEYIKYIKYSYYDEIGKYIAVVANDTPDYILDEMIFYAKADKIVKESEDK